MKKLCLLLLLLTLCPLLGGCSLLPARTFDGSEQFNEAHPQYNNPPDYMQPGDRHTDGT